MPRRKKKRLLKQNELPPGVYSMVITSVSTNPSGTRLRIEMEIGDIGRIKNTMRLTWLT